MTTPADPDMETKPTAVTRPNGKTYQPESLRAGCWEDDYAGEAGVIVLGTHDIDTALPIAEQHCEYWHGARYAIKPRTGWWRLAYAGCRGEQSWVHDPVRAPAGVMFTASDDPEEQP